MSPSPPLPLLLTSSITRNFPPRTRIQGIFAIIFHPSNYSCMDSRLFENRKQATTKKNKKIDDFSFFFLRFQREFRFTDHPNVKCYFGHGGLLGLTEGIQSGVPMILMPFYGDQYTNAAAAQTRGVAIILEYHDFIEEKKLRNVIDQIFNDTR